MYYFCCCACVLTPLERGILESWKKLQTNYIRTGTEVRANKRNFSQQQKAQADLDDIQGTQLVYQKESNLCTKYLFRITKQT